MLKFIELNGAANIINALNALERTPCVDLEKREYLLGLIKKNANVLCLYLENIAKHCDVTTELPTWHETVKVYDNKKT